MLLGKSSLAIKMYENAYKILPEDIDIIQRLVALYCDNDRSDEAKNFLEHILPLHKNDYLLNKIFVDVLYQDGVPIEQILPYIKRYFNNKPDDIVPLMYKLIVKLFSPKFKQEEYIDNFQNYSSEWEQWAKTILNKYDTK